MFLREIRHFFSKIPIFKQKNALKNRKSGVFRRLTVFDT